MMSQINSIIKDMNKSGQRMFDNTIKGINSIGSQLQTLDKLYTNQKSKTSFTKDTIKSIADQYKDILNITKQSDINQKNILTDKFKELDITESRVSQIHKEALSKLAKYV